MFSAFFTRLRDALLKQYIRTSQVVPERSVFSACKCSDKILAATPWRVLAVRTPGIQRLWSWSTFRELRRQNDINDEPGWRIKRLKFHSSFWFLEGLAESSVSMLRSDPQTCVVFWKLPPLNIHQLFIQALEITHLHLHLHPTSLHHQTSTIDPWILNPQNINTNINISININIIINISIHPSDFSSPNFFKKNEKTNPANRKLPSNDSPSLHQSFPPRPPTRSLESAAPNDFHPPTPEPTESGWGWHPILWGIFWNTLQCTNIAGC